MPIARGTPARYTAAAPLSAVKLSLHYHVDDRYDKTGEIIDKTGEIIGIIVFFYLDGFKVEVSLLPKNESRAERLNSSKESQEDKVMLIR